MTTTGVVAAAFLVVGVAAPANAALPPTSLATGLTGSRPNATQLPFRVSDEVGFSVDVATGNLKVTSTKLTLPGVVSDVSFGETYNTFGATIGSTAIMSAKNWTVGVDGAGYLSQGTGKVVYTSGDGAMWPFTPVSGSTTAYTSPAGFKADLVGVSGGTFTLTDRVSRQVVTFNINGQPTQVADRNGNTTTLTYVSGEPSTVVSSAGPSPDGRKVTLSYDAATYTLTASQTNGALTRSLTYVKDANSNLMSISDADGKTTTFTYSGGRMATITAPGGGGTTFSYDGSGKVTRVVQGNSTAGSPGNSSTRISYPSTTQTLVAGPNTDQAVAVATVPHTTYTINATTDLVTAATDAAGRVRSATYNGNADATSVTNGSGATAGTTSGTYGANSGESLTSAQSPSGASSSNAYDNTAAATKYLPSGSTDDAGQASTYTYNGAGNALTATDAMAATATLTYNTSGQVLTATAPGNGANKTVYAYDTNKQLSTITPVTGTSLGVKTFTYDGFGRVKTATDGRGTTSTFTYDKQDRLLSTDFSGTTPTVTNTYTDTGQLKTRVDGNGTTTYSYDQLGQLISRVNTAGGGTIGYGYDKAGNLASTTDTRGTTTYTYDAGNVPLQVIYPKSAGPQVLQFAVDDQGRRTDSWLQSNPAHTLWTAHTKTEYDKTGRVSRAIAQSGTGDSSNTTTMDVTYCYNSATAAPTCSTGTSTDRKKLQWSKDNLTGQTTTYTYDAAGRVTQVAQSGGTGANTYAYVYDSKGNRTSATVTGATPSTQAFTVNAGNQITNTGYTFDGTGNMIADPAGSYAYNGAQQMTTVTQGSTMYNYKYAGTTQNEVLQQQSGSSTYILTYGRTDQVGNPVIEQVKVGSTTAYVENDPVTGQPLMLQLSSGVETLYVYNGTGNPVAMLTDFGTTSYAYAFDPYGVPVLTAGGSGSATTSNPFMFKGGIQDRATGWVHYGARWYNPTTGRWTQQDTLDSPLNPTNANRYAFAGDDPINNSDPTGRVPVPAPDAYSAVGVGCAVVGGLINPYAGIALGVGCAFAPQISAVTQNAVIGVGNGLCTATNSVLAVGGSPLGSNCYSSY